MARATAKTRAPKRGAKRPPVKRAPVKRTPDVRQRARDAFDGLEQRHFDLIGLIMIAIGVYSAFVLYLGWDGGAVGGGSRRRSNTRSGGWRTSFRLRSSVSASP